MTKTMTSNAQMVNDWLEFALREQNLASTTIYKYGLSMDSFVTHLGGRSMLAVDADVLRAWVHVPNKRTGEPPSPATVKRKTCELRSLFNFLVDVQQMAHFNTAKQLHVPTVHNEEPKPAPEAEWRALWASDMADADRVAFGLGYFNGLRRHEATLLGVHNFVSEPKPRIANFKRKGGKKMSLPYVSCALFYAQRRPDLIGGDAASFLDPLHDLMKVQREAEAPRLLPWRELQRPGVRYQRHPMPEGIINPNQFNRHLRSALDDVGLPELAFSPHQLRHSFGTNMLAMGMGLLEVSRLMGHSSVTVTQRYIATVEDPFQRHLDDDDGDMGVLVSGPWG